MAILDWKLCRQASIRWKALKAFKPFLCIFLKDIRMVDKIYRDITAVEFFLFIKEIKLFSRIRFSENFKF